VKIQVKASFTGAMVITLDIPRDLHVEDRGCVGMDSSDYDKDGLLKNPERVREALGELASQCVTIGCEPGDDIWPKEAKVLNVELVDWITETDDIKTVRR